MKKYVGIAKQVIESMNGIGYKFLVRFSDDKTELEKWLKEYPNSQKLILENNDEVQNFFKDFVDYSPTTRKEKKAIRKLRDRILGD